MEKVKLTQEQAEAIEKLKEEHLKRLKKIMNNPEYYDFTDLEKPLLGLTANEYFDALYNGYEVEETYKVGGYITRLDNGLVFKITGVNHQEKYVYGSSSTIHYFKNIRHSTDEEIENEKQRIWWKKHGRDVWELRGGDALKSRNIKIVEQVEKLDHSYDGEEIVIFGGGNWEYFTDVKRKYDIVYFAEDRKDIK